MVGGRVRFLERHVARLCRDARLLGIGELEAPAVREQLLGLARSAGGERILRAVAGRDGGGALRLAGELLPFDPPPPGGWRASCEASPHPGAGPVSGCKSAQRSFYDAAAARARAAGADEALLFDGQGRLVEGARSNLVAVLPDGALCTPPLSRGAVAGIAREILLSRLAELLEGDVGRSELGGLRELVALNAVRGAVAITRVGASRVGDGLPGPWAERLARELHEEDSR